MDSVIIKIDKDGYYVEDVIINSQNPEYPEFYTEIRLPVDEDGNQLPFYRPLWDGEKWVEDMSQEEIDDLVNQSRLPTREEELELKLANLEQDNFNIMLATTEMYEEQYNENINLMLAITELYEMNTEV